MAINSTTAPLPQPVDPPWMTPAQYLDSVTAISNVYSLNSFKDRLLKAYGVNPLLSKPSYEAIWKRMHRQAKELLAAWNSYH